MNPFLIRCMPLIRYSTVKYLSVILANTLKGLIVKYFKIKPVKI